MAQIRNIKSKLRKTPVPGTKDFLGMGGHRTAFVRGTRTIIKRLNDPPRFIQGFRKKSNPNLIEWENYQRFFKNVPPAIQNSFMRVRKMKGTAYGPELHVERVLNDDGSPSKTLAHYHSLSNPYFWKRAQQMVDWMAVQKIGFYDWKPENFLVRWVSKEKCVPVLIDYENIGAKKWKSQPWLHIPFFSKKKMQRRMERLKQRFQPE